MESEKPRFVSILAETAVVSDKPRVYISAARPVAAAAADAFLLTRNLSGSFSAGSFPIRAPLTIDDDDDSGSVTDEHNSASSDASSYSRGLDSGTDDGFESVSGEAEDESALEDVIMGGIRVHRLLGEELGGETGDRIDFLGGSVISRPFAGDVDEVTSVNYSSLEEESENSNEFDGVSESEVSEVDRVSMKAKVVIPRAIVSLDDDEFDEILGSDDEEVALLRVTKALGDEETQVEDRTSQFGDVGMVGEQECLDSVIGESISTEEETVRTNYAEKLDNCSMSFGNIEEPSLGVPPGGCNDFVVETEEASMELGRSFTQLIGKGVAERSMFKEDGGDSIHEVEALMKPGDVDGAVELGEMGMTGKLEYSGSVAGELVSTEEDMVQVKLCDDGLVSSEISLGVKPGDCNEFLVESESDAVDADRGLKETFSQLVEQGVDQGSISKESDNRVDDGSACDADESMILCEGSIGLRSRESSDEDTGNMTDEPQECCENDCGALNELDKPECEGEPKIGMSFERFQVTPTLNSETLKNLEVAGEVDVSGCGCSDQKAEQESENEGIQESEDNDRNSSLPDEDGASSLKSSFETANETGENGEQMNKQFNFHSDCESNQIEETSLVSVKDVERTMPENSSVTASDTVENETQMARLIGNHTFMKLDEYEGKGDSREKLSESTFAEELSSSPVQLISERVKERVERTQLLKAQLQRFIRKPDLCSKNSASTEVVSKLSLAAGEHQASLGLDYVSDRRKIMLPEQDFSINVLVIGKTGVGKSATVNSIFGETKAPVGAFGVTTKTANYVVGNVGGILVRILDTPGLSSSATDERFNEKVLMLIKKSMRTFPVDVILYINRLDEQPDIHLLRIITSSLGSSIWQNTIVVLTHAASNVSDSSSYRDFIAQRSSLMHQSIRQAVPEQSKMPGIVVAENNMSSFCGNEAKESTCVDWRFKLVMLCCSVKLMRSKADSLAKHNALVENPDDYGSFTQFCSLWNSLLHGASPKKGSQLHDDLEEKKQRRLMESYPEILWGDQRPLIRNQEAGDEEKEKTIRIVGCGRRGRGRGRGRLGFQATKRLGIYLDTTELHTGFSIGDRRKQEEEEQGKIFVRMRGSMAVLGLVPMLVSIFTSVYGGKDI